MKILTMPDLGFETKRLINGGSWGLYEYGPEDYIIATGAYCECCNPHEQKFYKITSSGKFVSEVTKEEYLRPAKDHIRFDLPIDKSEIIFKLFNPKN